MSVNIVRAMTDPKLFGPHFAGPTWAAWKTVLKATFGLPLNVADRRRFLALTGRKSPPKDVRELWVIAGRRAGKSVIAALTAVWIAFFKDHSQHLARGERGHVLIINPDRRQGKIVLGYIDGFISANRMLERLVSRRTGDGIELSNGITITIATASFRTVRGYTAVACIVDELAFLRSEESMNPDVEILNAVRPAMATIPTSLLVCISSPYARRGALFSTFERHYAKPSEDVLVVKAPSRTLNPSVPGRVIEDALERDPASARAEWLAEFRSDVESFVSLDAIRACVIPDRRELPPTDRLKYFAFTDPSGGSSDSFTLSIAHREGDRAVLDAVRERKPPFNPSQVVEEFAALLRAYRITRVEGDRYAGEWPREAFRGHGITYRPAEKTKSELYLTLLPAINSGRVELIDHPRLIAQLVGLERRTARGGRDSVDHGPGGHDDVANAAAGALHLAESKARRPPFFIGGGGDAITTPENLFARSLTKQKERQEQVRMERFMRRQHRGL